MTSRLRDEGGVGLIELLIAMTVMSIGIFALVAGFSSSAATLNRASKTATAGTVADKRMEDFHRQAYSAFKVTTPTPSTTTVTGADGRTYWVGTVVEPYCVLDGTTPTTTCADVSGVKSRPTMRVTVTVRDGASATDPILVKQTSTFDESTG